MSVRRAIICNNYEVMRDGQAAFRWIVSILQDQRANFAIVGGLAVNAYESMRALAEIGLYRSLLILAYTGDPHTRGS